MQRTFARWGAHAQPSLSTKKQRGKHYACTLDPPHKLRGSWQGGNRQVTAHRTSPVPSTRRGIPDVQSWFSRSSNLTRATAVVAGGSVDTVDKCISPKIAWTSYMCVLGRGKSHVTAISIAVAGIPKHTGASTAHVSSSLQACPNVHIASHRHEPYAVAKGDVYTRVKIMDAALPCEQEMPALCHVIQQTFSVSFRIESRCSKLFLLKCLELCSISACTSAAPDPGISRTFVVRHIPRHFDRCISYLSLTCTCLRKLASVKQMTELS